MKLSELTFKPHPSGRGAMHATVEFESGYGATVSTGPLFYTSKSSPYEVGVTKDGCVCCDTPITDYVLGYQTESEVEAVLDQIKALS